MKRADLLNSASFAVIAATTISLMGAAVAQEAETTTPEAEGIYTLDEMVVISERDRAGLLETEPSDVLFGLNKPLLETPRSASFVSDTTMERYGVETVDDLKATTPGTATSSFYGIPGSVNVRGRLAESYFRGFKRIENRGTYPTLLGASSRVDIVRGPPTPNYGPGKVGGLLNFVPKTAKIDGGNGYIAELTGEIEATYGAYNKRNAAVQVGVPVEFGDVFGGVYAYAEREDSESYYKGISPEHTMFQATSDLDFGEGFRTSFGGQYFKSDGYVQTPGWNRITQDLIDNGTYITGRDTFLSDSDNNGYLTPNEITTGDLTNYYFGFTPTVTQAATLDTGVGTTTIDNRTVYISDHDFSETETVTLFADFVKEIGDDELMLQFFYDSLDNERFVSYGFPADYKSWTAETRLTYTFEYDPEDPIEFNGSFGASYRYTDANKKESYNSGRIALDRRDISYGATATDILDSPFSSGDGGQGWENDVKSNYGDAGIFLNVDVTYWDFMSILLGARYDYYDVETEDVGILSYAPAGKFEDTDTAFTYNASIMFETPWGVRPYFTYAETTAIEIGQAGDVTPNLVDSAQWLSDGELIEGGFKFEMFDAALTGSLAAYQQQRTRVGRNSVVTGEIGRGIEAEFRYLATENLSFTFAGNLQETRVKGPDSSFYYVRPSDIGLTGVNAYGEGYAVYQSSSIIGNGSYTDESIPQSVLSLYGSYTSDPYDWGSFGGTLGVVYTSDTSAKLATAVHLPSYTVVNGAAFVDIGDFTVKANVDNILDETFYTPLADLYGDIGVLPGKGREWSITGVYHF